MEVNDNEEQDPSGLLQGTEVTLSPEFIASALGYWTELSDPGTILLGSLCWPMAGCAHLSTHFPKFIYQTVWDCWMFLVP
jgi:hypothetical protein